MLPHAYELPAAIVLAAAGLITCLAGYRLFRFVLAIWGFLVGAAIGSSMMGVGSTLYMILAGLVGGILGALALVFAYFVGVALVGAGMGALAAHVAWSQFGTGDPSAAVVIGASVAGAIVAMILQRYVIIVGTAFSGAWLVVVGAIAASGSLGSPATRAAAGDVWILYPLTPAPGQRWVIGAWLLGALIGTGVQLSFPGGNSRSARK
jgi:Domain of unknown function (DUF4203)